VDGTPDLTTGELLTADAPVVGVWLPPAAAAARLGLSERTLWRQVKAGRYHKRTLGGRSTVLVPLPDMTTDVPDDRATPEADTAVATVSGSLSGVTDMAPAGAAAWSTAVLTPIMARMAEQETTIRDQAEMIGRLTAELESLRASQRPIAGSGTPEPRDLTPGAPADSGAASVPWWKRWLLAAYG
jgi:hypothetical protein